MGFAGEIESEIRIDALLFGEGQSRIIVSLPEGNLSTFQKLAEGMGVPTTILGFVSPDRMKIQVKQNGIIVGSIDVSTEKIADTWGNAIKCKMER